VRELLRLRSTSPDPYMDNAVVGEKKSSRLGRAKSTKREKFSFNFPPFDGTAAAVVVPLLCLPILFPSCSENH